MDKIKEKVLEKHIKYDEVGNYECLLCGEYFYNLIEIEQHLIDEHANEIIDLTIQECEKESINIDDLTSSEIDDLIEQLIFQKVEIESQKTAQQIIIKVEKLISKINKYKSEVDDMITIGRQNAMNDLENELKQLKQKFLGE
ncbi:MAG: hypothetical protein ACE5J3_08725 [Methanosarcinales archaeon]